jgi:hypothetical protein
MSTTRTVISKSKKKKNGTLSEMVVYRTPNGKKTNGKPAFTSKTRHEAVR